MEEQKLLIFYDTLFRDIETLLQKILKHQKIITIVRNPVPLKFRIDNSYHLPTGVM